MLPDAWITAVAVGDPPAITVQGPPWNKTQYHIALSLALLVMNEGAKGKSTIKYAIYAVIWGGGMEDFERATGGELHQYSSILNAEHESM